MRIKKIQTWANPGAFGLGKPRIDMDVWYEEGSRVRHTGLGLEEYRRITEALVTAWPEAWGESHEG